MFLHPGRTIYTIVPVRSDQAAQPCHMSCPVLLRCRTSKTHSLAWEIHSKHREKLHLHPGVLAFGYVNSTIPAPDFSSNSATLVFTPSCVCTSPPKLAISLMLLPSALSFSALPLPFVAAAFPSEASGELSAGFDVSPVITALALSASFLIFALCCAVVSESVDCRVGPAGRWGCACVVVLILYLI